ncbi:MAG: metal-dependent hydrolase [Planctomycetia bacterium]|nr:metal-dependent hydrolase [Planctomycetia bacterium]
MNTPKENLFSEDQSKCNQLKYKDLTIEGFSRAAVQTFWRISEYKLGFDLGWQPWEFMGTPRWFISHTHMDHILALPAYIARRRMMKMEPPTIYLPAEKVIEVRQLLNVFARLDRGQLPCQLIGLEDGDTVELSRELVVTVSKTFHTIPSLGYLVWERRKKLKPEYLSLTGEEIRNLNQSGVQLTNEIRLPKVAFLGDTTAAALDYYPDFYRAEILITEMTFVAPHHRREAINKFGHFHLDDLIERRENFKNEKIIASHFSTRYYNRQIEQFVRKQLPDMLDNRLILWF